MRPRLIDLAAVALLAGCVSQPAQPAQQLDTSGPLEALAACEPPPSPAADTVEGLIVPDGTVVTKVTRQGPLVNVAGYVEMTPVQFEQAYAELDSVTILMSENEIFEAELLVGSATHRNFLKATATCRTGSQLIVVVAPELDAEGLPTPQGTLPAPTASPRSQP